MKIEFTEEQVKNLEIFLSRVDLKGYEAIAFFQIMNAITKPKKDDQNEKDS